jgi:hypothetical protein
VVRLAPRGLGADSPVTPRQAAKSTGHFDFEKNKKERYLQPVFKK